MIRQNDKILAQELVKKGYASQAVINQHLLKIQKSDENLNDLLLKHNVVTEAQMLECLCAAFQLPSVDLKTTPIPKSVIDQIPVRLAWYFKFMPLGLTDKTLTIAVAFPLDVKSRDEIRQHLRLEPQIVLATPTDITDAMNRYYGLGAHKIDRLSREALKGPSREKESAAIVEDLEKGADEVSISKLVNQIILEAFRKRATDIHIEPYRNKVRIRTRIDGVLVDTNVPPAVKQFLPSIISRIKIMANLSIVEKRIPQDGSAVVKTQDQHLDLRISVIPTVFGESMVIRILPTQVMFRNLERLGLEKDNLALFRTLVKKPHGILLVTGPTGSGKTTTLYACLNEINSPERKIITLEDPIEYELEGITQIPIRAKVNMDFAAGLRSILRHDPDIIMVGEIRDLETAEIAIRTALTGHLVFSTLHTNDAASGITRLIEMGVEPFLISSSIEAFAAQRLVRLICPKCKEEDTSVSNDVKEEIAKSLKIAEPKRIKIFRGRGCDACNRTGFYGRSAIYEILTINDDIRAAILEKKRADEIKTIAVNGGMVTLRQNGWQKVLAGLTTPAEVLNVSEKDQEIVPASSSRPTSGEIPAAPGAHVLVVPPDVLSAKDEYNARTYPRINAKVGIRYSLIRQAPEQPNKLITDGVEHSSITKDISAGGLRFVSGYTLPVGTIVQLKIQLSKESRSIDCLAKVCRVEDDNLSAMFNLAVYYLDITSADRVQISDFVAARLKDGSTPPLPEAGP